MSRKFDPRRLTEHQAAYLQAAVDGTLTEEQRDRGQVTAAVLRRRGFIASDEMTPTEAGRALVVELGAGDKTEDA